MTVDFSAVLLPNAQRADFSAAPNTLMANVFFVVDAFHERLN